MKHKILIVIYIVCVLSILSSIATILTSESLLEKAYTGITAFISAIVIGGLWTRNEVGRKIAIYYFGIQILFSLFGFILGLIAIIGGEYTGGIIFMLITTAIITLFIFIIRGLNNPTLLNEFN